MKNRAIIISIFIIFSHAFTEEIKPHEDAENLGDAIEWHQKRVQLNETEDGVYASKLEIARIFNDLGMRVNVVIKAYEDAINFSPHRLEAVYYLAQLCNKHTKYSHAYQILKTQQSLSEHTICKYFPGGEWILEYGLLFQLSISAYHTGRYKESLIVCNQLLNILGLPPEWRETTTLRAKKITEKLKHSQSTLD